MDGIANMDKPHSAVNAVARRSLVFLVLALGVPVAFAAGQTLQPQQIVKLTGDIAHPDQLSGVTTYRNLLVICPDEGASFNVLKRTSADNYQLVQTIDLFKDESREIDMEGAASDADNLYIVGSHSAHRKTIDEDRTYQKNLERLVEVEDHPDSHYVFRLTLKNSG